MTMTGAMIRGASGALVLAGLAAAPAAAETFRVGEWDGRSVASAAPAAAPPAACVAISRQAQGAALALRLDHAGTLVVLTTHQRWTAPAGRDLGALVAFDERARQSTTARVLSPGTLRLALADPAAFAAALRSARALQVYAAGVAVSFRLEDVGAVLDRLAACAGIAPPTRTDAPQAAAPPAPSAAPAPDAAPAPAAGPEARADAPDDDHSAAAVAPPVAENRFLARDSDNGAVRFIAAAGGAGAAVPRWPLLQREFAPMRPGEAQGLPLTPADVERFARQTVHLLWVDASDKETWTTVGSAVAVSQDTLLTNCHVVRESRRIWMRQGGRSAQPTLLAANDATDRCLIRVEGFPLTPVNGVRPIASLRPGEAVYSLGNPGGRERVFGAGVISAVRQRRGVAVVQTTAPMAPGSSGGGLFDAHGNLVGITSFRLIGAGRQSGGYAIAAEEFWR
jgi:S1-C subfamily serine protease